MAATREWRFWLTQGRGRRWIWGLAAVLGVVLGSLYLAHQRERGPDEWTLEQALAGRQLAEGHGWSTPVNYPQTVAVLEARGALNFAEPLPELYHPPLYGGLIGTALAASGDGVSWQVLDDVRAPYGPDRLLLVLNAVGLWLTLLATWCLGCWLWRPAIAAVATAAVLLSTTLWEHLVAVDGTTWLMLLTTLLLAALAWTARQSGWKRGWGAAATGLLLGLLGLGDYALLVWLPVALVWLGWGTRGKMRWALPLLAGVVALAVLMPWFGRNIGLTGHPLGLAGQSVALRAGDPTADPLLARAALEAAAPELSFRKLLNKGLTGWRDALQADLWQGGGLFVLLALFSALYGFQRAEIGRWRWLVLALLGSVVLVPPFFVSGLSPRSPVLYLLPGLALVGTAFFEVVRKNTRGDHHAWQLGAVAALLILHGLPLVQRTLEPRRLPFQYPPYFPVALRQLAALDGRLGLPSGAVADLPAGWSWYAGGDFRVWRQPTAPADLAALCSYVPIHLQYFSPQLVDEAFGAALVQPQPGTWEPVYAHLARGETPAGYPLPRVQPLADGGLIALPANAR